MKRMGIRMGCDGVVEEEEGRRERDLREWMDQRSGDAGRAVLFCPLWECVT